MKTSSLLGFLLAVLLCIFSARVHAQWVKTNGPLGITTTKFLKLGNTIYVGTRYAGVYKSYDNGTTWQNTGTGLEHNTISCLAADGQYIYAGATYGQLYRSADSGHTWQQSSTGLVDTFNNQVGVNCMISAAGQMWVGSALNGVYKSSDHGSTWHQANAGALTQSYIMGMVYQAPNIFASTSSYLYVSGDLGNSWDLRQDNTQFWPLNNFWHKGDTMLASTNHGTGHIFRSTDGGNNWTNLTLGNGTTYICRFENTHDTIYAGSGRTTYRSLDWGQTWTAINAPGRDIHGNDFLISNNRFLMSNNSTGIHTSNDRGQTWTQTLTGFPPTSYVSAMLTINNKVYAASDGIYSTTDHGNTWARATPVLDTLSNTKVMFMLNPAPNIILAGTGYTLYRSADNGLTWQHITTGLMDPAGQNKSIGVQGLAKSGSNIIAATNVGIFYSTDLGLTWRVTNASTLAGPVFAAFSVAAHGNVVCAAASTGISTGDGIYRSVDNGVSWNFVSQEPDVYLVAYAGGNRFLISTLFGSVSTSTDNGLTFYSTPGFNVYNENYSNDFLAINNHVFSGNFARAYHSSDTGSTFAAVDNTATWPNESAYSLTHDNTYLYAGTGNAVWRRPLADFGIVIPTSVDEVATSQKVIVQPNPSTGRFTITIPQDVNGSVSLKVFSMSGTLVLDRAMDAKEQARHEAEIDLTSLPSGNYILEASSIKYIDIQKLVIN